MPATSMMSAMATSQTIDKSFLSSNALVQIHLRLSVRDTLITKITSEIVIGELNLSFVDEYIPQWPVPGENAVAEIADRLENAKKRALQVGKKHKKGKITWR